MYSLHLIVLDAQSSHRGLQVWGYRSSEFFSQTYDFKGCSCRCIHFRSNGTHHLSFEHLIFCVHWSGHVHSAPTLPATLKSFLFGHQIRKYAETNSISFAFQIISEDDYSRVQTHRRHSDVRVLNDGHERYLYAGEHGELPGQVQHHAKHEAGFQEAANHCVGVECHRAAHLVHITLQAGRKTSWAVKGRKGEIYVKRKPLVSKWPFVKLDPLF